jgi:hypothetical protein
MAKIFSAGFTKLLSSFFLFIGKLIITAVGAFVAGYGAYKVDSQIHLGPPLVATLCCYVLSYYIIEIISLVIDTIYFCFLYEDTVMQREREQGMKPWAPEGLASLLE